MYDLAVFLFLLMTLSTAMAVPRALRDAIGQPACLTVDLLERTRCVPLGRIKGKTQRHLATAPDVSPPRTRARQEQQVGGSVRVTDRTSGVSKSELRTRVVSWEAAMRTMNLRRSSSSTCSRGSVGRMRPGCLRHGSGESSPAPETPIRASHEIASGVSPTACGKEPPRTD